MNIPEKLIRDLINSANTYGDPERVTVSITSFGALEALLAEPVLDAEGNNPPMGGMKL